MNVSQLKILIPRRNELYEKKRSLLFSYPFSKFISLKGTTIDLEVEDCFFTQLFRILRIFKFTQVYTRKYHQILFHLSNVHSFVNHLNEHKISENHILNKLNYWPIEED